MLVNKVAGVLCSVVIRGILVISVLFHFHSGKDLPRPLQRPSQNSTVMLPVQLLLLVLRDSSEIEVGVVLSWNLHVKVAQENENNLYCATKL